MANYHRNRPPASDYDYYGAPSTAGSSFPTTRQGPATLAPLPPPRDYRPSKQQHQAQHQQNGYPSVIAPMKGSRDTRRNYYGQGQQQQQQQPASVRNQQQQQQHPSQHSGMVLSDRIYMDIEDDRATAPYSSSQRPAEVGGDRYYESSVTNPHNTTTTTGSSSSSRRVQPSSLLNQQQQLQQPQRTTRRTVQTLQQQRQEHYRPPAVTTTDRADTTLIMFGDPYEGASVMTGMSQQELLRKKSRAHSAKQQRKSSSHKDKNTRSSKKKDRILNMPGNLLLGVGSNKKKSYHAAADEGKNSAMMLSQQAPARNSGQQQQQQTYFQPSWMNPSSDKEYLSSTAESSSMLEDSRDPTRHSYDLPYSSIQVMQGVMNAGADESWLYEPATADVEPDARSVGSFPLLSTSANSTMMDGSGIMENSNDSYRRDVSMQTSPNQDNRGAHRGTPINAALVPPNTNRRGVRFAANVASSTLLYDRYEAADATEIPWDEENDNRSPTGVGDFRNYSTPPQLKGRQQQQQTIGKPVSILRNRRFVSEVGSPNFQRTRLYGSPSRSNDTSPFVVESLAVAAVNTSIVLSPPRNGPGFMYTNGVEVSPIRPSRRNDSERPVPPVAALGMSSYGHSTERFAFAYNNNYGVVDNEDSYPDPPLELDIDEESTLASVHMGFIEAVAAIVVQTAYRRYIAAKSMGELRLVRYREAAEYEHLQRAPDDYERSQRAAAEYGRSHVAAEDERRQVPAQERARETAAYELSHAAAKHERGREAVEYKRPQVVVEQNRSQEFAENQHSQRVAEYERTQAEAPAQKENQKFESMAYVMYELAAVQIQSSFRGFWVRDCLSVDRYCAIVIQKAFRRFRIRNHYHYDVYRIIVVQSIWRRNIVCSEVSKSFKDQAWEADPSRLAHRATAAIRIQSRWRSYAVESVLIRTLVDVLIVQTVVRRWAARRHAALRRNGAQPFFRQNTGSYRYTDKAFEDAPGQITMSSIRMPNEGGSDWAPSPDQGMTAKEWSRLHPDKGLQYQAPREWVTSVLSEEKKSELLPEDQKVIRAKECSKEGVNEGLEHRGSNDWMELIPCNQKTGETLPASRSVSRTVAALVQAVPPQREPVVADIEVSDVGTSNLLSMWKQRERQNTFVVGGNKR